MDELTTTILTAPEIFWHDRDGTKQPVLRGLACPYWDGTPGTEFNIMGNVYERFSPGAFREVLASNPDVFCRADHLATKTMGRTPRLKLWEDAKGLNFENPLSRSTTCNDLVSDYENGIYKGCSIRFGCDFRNPTNADWHREGKREIVTIKRVQSIRDVGPVQEPAYTSTQLTVYRSAYEAWLLDEETKARLELYSKLRSK